MIRSHLATLLSLALASAIVIAHPRQLPSPVLDPKAKGEQTAVLAGGCFWGVEAVFESLVGVNDVVSGYAGGSKASATYDVVSSGTTGHAESVRIRYDASRISYGQLLKVFFAVAHNPTELNRQGPDIGPQYRSPSSSARRNRKPSPRGESVRHRARPSQARAPRERLHGTAQA